MEGVPPATRADLTEENLLRADVPRTFEQRYSRPPALEREAGTAGLWSLNGTSGLQGGPYGRGTGQGRCLCQGPQNQLAFTTLSCLHNGTAFLSCSLLVAQVRCKHSMTLHVYCLC